MDTSRSADLYRRALKLMPGGCSRNTILRHPHPFYAAFGTGCRVTDVEGIERIDFANNMASLIHGNAHPLICAAVGEQLKKGSAYAYGTEAEILFAEHMVSRSAGFNKIRFVNSGTEAIMACLKAARAFTGRPKIAKTEGAYHGLYDYAEVSQTASPDNWGTPDRPASVPVSHGTPLSALNDVVVLPFNDAGRAVSILDQHADDIACVLIDVMPHRIGLIPAADAFVQALRSWTSKNNALLVFDEVITLRTSYGGAQECYDVLPDLTALGKMIGGGFPVGALTGRADVMDVMDPWTDPVLFPHAGTFSANPVTMTAGRVAMEAFDRQAIKVLNALGEDARTSLREAIAQADVPASVSGRGSMFRMHFRPLPPENYRDSYASAGEKKAMQVFLDHLYDGGITLIHSGTGALSTPMDRAIIDRLAETVLQALRAMRALLEATDDDAPIASHLP